MQYYKLIKIGEFKIKSADFKILPAQKQIFSQIRTLQVRAYAIHAITKLSNKGNFFHKIALKRCVRFDHDNWYVNMELPFFPTEIEARRELSHVGLISKNHYHPQTIQFDVLEDPRWQANIEKKTRPFLFRSLKTFFSKTEARFITHEIITGFSMPQIIPGLTVPVKTQNTNIMSSTH